MIAVDTSSFVSYFVGDSGKDVDALVENLASERIILPSVTIMEMLSDPKLPVEVADYIKMIPELPEKSGFWVRAAATRKTLLKKRLKARVADTLVAQGCLDHELTLISRDRDFRNFEKYCGLKVIWPK